jgi:hypothetical protein
MTFTGWLLTAAISCFAIDSAAATGHVDVREVWPTDTPWVQHVPDSYDWHSTDHFVQIANHADKPITVSVWTYYPSVYGSVLYSSGTIIKVNYDYAWQVPPTGVNPVAVFVWCPVGEGTPRINVYGSGSCE